MPTSIEIPEGNLILQDSDGNVTLVSCADTFGILNTMITQLQDVNTGSRNLAASDEIAVTSVYNNIKSIRQIPRIL
jgi:hypothetical protein